MGLQGPAPTIRGKRTTGSELCEKAFDLVVDDIRVRNRTHVAKVDKLVRARRFFLQQGNSVGSYTARTRTAGSYRSMLAGRSGASSEVRMAHGAWCMVHGA